VRLYIADKTPPKVFELSSLPALKKPPFPTLFHPGNAKTVECGTS
jgi:hypothetical protein